MAENKSGSISLEKITDSIKQYVRILQLTRKPSMEEFLTISKVAGAGILLIGVIGFIIYLIMVLIPTAIVG
ncbi:protein translocase subunit secE/sec61 gamma [Methanocella conradii HZ254]|uniref:Protein translocase subunit SecE n=1 Tax=Methanocella conradii (strain DSM 24694 / JCM 17849 / CGMCC 1.5162 / HZ254) TaxID=1041930 RepID=H8I7E5_METCZ|nr:protein translocase SEC61 complex subunit gamma [Methanocella conradii]AFD00811.1 protein translocase subunit secE/sec61 gamma [Methanocella conradii HZ254]MDI6897910.1 protein translocase SEC61 complex subunit gamma [Methanocella conradii]